MMQRVAEPELMNDADQALVYAQADFSEPHDHFVELFKQSLSDDKFEGCILDLGCGPGDICLRMARAFPEAEIFGVDGAEAMLALGREAIKQQGLAARVRLLKAYLPMDNAPTQHYAAITSNSLLHHLADPNVLWQSIQANAQKGTQIFIMDLMRPESTEQATKLVDIYAADEPAILRHDFYHSLLAAYTVDEVAAQLAEHGMRHLQIEVVSDRHFIVHGVWR